MRSQEDRVKLITQFNQLLASLLIPITIPTQSSKIPIKLLLKVLESLLEIRFDSLSLPLSSPSTSTTTLVSPGVSSTSGKEEEMIISTFLVKSLEEVLSSSFLLSKTKSRSKDEIIIGGLIMIGIEMNLINPPSLSPSTNSHPLSLTPFFSQPKNSLFSSPSPSPSSAISATKSKYALLQEIVNPHNYNEPLESSPPASSPRKSQLRSRALISELEGMRWEEEGVEIEVKERRKRIGLPTLIKPRPIRKEWERRGTKIEEVVGEEEVDGESTPTPKFSSLRSQSSRNSIRAPTKNDQSYLTRKSLALSADYAKRRPASS